MGVTNCDPPPPPPFKNPGYAPAHDTPLRRSPLRLKYVSCEIVAFLSTFKLLNCLFQPSFQISTFLTFFFRS